MDTALRALLSRLESEGQRHDQGEPEHDRRMLNLERATAEVLALWVRSSHRRSVLEIGTSNGYSTLWLAWAVQPAGGRVTSIDRSAAKHALADANLREAGLRDSVELAQGEGAEVVVRLDGPFDALFFDADRCSAPAQLDLLMPRLAPDVLLFAVDNSPRLKPGDSCFTGARRVGQGPSRSYRLSTGIHREPHGKHVLRGIDIAVVPDAAFRAGPLAHVQWQGVEHMPAGVTAFGTGIPTVNLDQRAPVPRGFVFQLAHQLTPARIADSFGERVIAHQVLDRQRLHAHRLVLTNEAGRQLVQAITTLVGNPGMFARHLQARLLPILRAFLFARESALRMLQAALTARQMARVGDLLAGAEDGHVFQPHIYSNQAVHDWQRRHLLLEQERDEVAPGGVPGNGDGDGCPGQEARPVDVQRRVHLRQGKRAGLRIPAKRAPGVGGRLASMLRVEGGILGAALEEGAERFVQVAQRLLQRHTGYLIEPGGFGLLLEGGERRRRLMIADALLPLIVGVRPQTQRPVVDEARAAERPRQHSGLCGRRVEPIAVGAFLLHAYNHSARVVSKQQALVLSARLAAPTGARRFIPMPEGRGLHAASFDNALSHPQEIAGYLAAVRALPGFASAIIPVGKGLSVAYRASAA
jgi:predicted O-methyltransferase YrrM